MYEFDEQRWDRQTAEVWDQANLVDAWLIQKTRVNPNANAPDGQRIYLQIGNGQWCTHQDATHFPTESAAKNYAQRFGYIVGQTAKVVRRRF